MDPFAPPLSDDELESRLSALAEQAKHGDLAARRAAFDALSDLSFSVGARLSPAIPLLVEGLTAADDQIGESALGALSRCGGDVIPTLLACLRHPVAFVRERAVHALGKMEEEAAPATAAVRESLGDGDIAVRRRAAWALGLMNDGHPETLATLFRLSRQASPSERSSALHALGNIAAATQDHTRLAPLHEITVLALADADDEVRLSALHALSGLRLAPAEQATLLVAVLQREMSDHAIVRALGLLDEVATAIDLSGHVMDLMRHFTSSRRAASILSEILTRMRPPPHAATEPLRAALEQDDVAVYAAKALWRLTRSSHEILPALERVFGQQGEAVCDLICEIGPAASPLLPKLLEALEDESYWDLQWAAADALGFVASNDPAIIDRLLGCLRHSSGIVRNASADALARLGEAAVSRLVTVLEDPSDGRRAWAARIAAAIGPDAAAAVPALRRGAAGQDARLARWCAIALARVAADATVVPVLVEILRSEQPEAPRVAAAEALGALGPAASGATAALREASLDPDPELREVAGAALQATGRPKN